MQALAASSQQKPSQFLLKQIGSKESLSWGVLGLFSLPSIQATLSYDPRRVGGTTSQWAMIAIIGLLLTALIFATGRQLIKPTREQSKPIQVILLFIFIGYARGIVLHFASKGLGLSTETDLLYRLTSGPIYTFSLLTVAAIAVGNLMRYRESMSKLSAERAKLRLSSVNLQSQISRVRTELVARVNGILEPAILDLESKLSLIKDSSSSATAVNSLKQTVDSVVRPLSRTVADPDFETLLTQPDTQYKNAVKAMPHVQGVKTRPLLAATVETAVTIGPAVLNLGLERGLFITAILGTSCLIVLWIVQALTEKRKYKPWVAALITVASFGISSYYFFIATDLVKFHLPPADQAQLFYSSVFLGLVFFFAELFQANSERNLYALVKTNQRYELLNSTLRRQVWLDHRRMASVIHGQMQGVLYASAMKLSLSETPKPQLIEAVRKEIKAALSNLAQKPANSENFSQVLDQMIDIWQDAVKFQIVIPKATLKVLNQNADAAECAIEVVREGLNNAVKHGEAKNIEIRISQLDSKLIKIKVINDGKPPKSATTAGYGSEVLGDFTHRWSLESVGDQVELNAEILI